MTLEANRILGAPSAEDPALAPKALRADAERNRRRVLAAAADLFAQRGLDVGLDEIARHAGVGTATVYRRFPDKGVLIEALFEERVEAAIALAENAAAHADPWAGLVALIEGQIEMQLADRGLKELLLGEGGCQSPILQERGVQVMRVIDGLVQRAKASGQLRADFETTDLVLIQVMIHAAGHFAVDADPGLWRRQAGMMLDGMRARRDAPTALAAPAISLSDLARLCGVPHLNATDVSEEPGQIVVE